MYKSLQITGKAYQGIVQDAKSNKFYETMRLDLKLETDLEFIDRYIFITRYGRIGTEGKFEIAGSDAGSIGEYLKKKKSKESNYTGREASLDFTINLNANSEDSLKLPIKTLLHLEVRELYRSLHKDKRFSSTSFNANEIPNFLNALAFKIVEVFELSDESKEFSPHQKPKTVTKRLYINWGAWG